MPKQKNPKYFYEPGHPKAGQMRRIEDAIEPAPLNKEGLRNLAKLGLLVTATAAAVGFVSETEARPNPYKVDTEAVAAMSPEQVASQFDVVTAGNDEDGYLGVMARRYMAQHGIPSGRDDLVDAMREQAIAHDGDATIMPGEQFLIPKQPSQP